MQAPTRSAGPHGHATSKLEHIEETFPHLHVGDHIKPREEPTGSTLALAIVEREARIE